MAEFSIRDKCSINTNSESDTFVGIKCENGDFSIHFPLGFHIAKEDKELRRDILLLMGKIKETTARRESEVYDQYYQQSSLSFPFQAYLTVIYDFYNRGYYKEYEVQYNVANRGKIDWSRTIKTQRPVLQDGNAFYLNFVTKKSSINENELITLIHEYCVYDSFEKIGWLFTDKMPIKPRLKYHYKLFKGIVKEKLSQTFNDRNKMLFRSMLAIIDYQGEEQPQMDYRFGTNRFEYVWEMMVDRVYGIKEKVFYFPKTTWKLGKDYDNACLEPDTIMLLGNKIFVLDAKYYKYGQTKRASDLPESTSINKQITYGEYIAENDKFDNKHGKDRTVYNAFIMPFDAVSKKWNCGESILCVGDAVSDWKSGCKEYEHILGILVDVKHLMQISVTEDQEEIMKLADCIEDYVNNVRDTWTF